MHFFLKRIDRTNRYDVFLDNGWNNWTRIQRNHWGVKVIAGNPLPRAVMRELNQRFVK
jgi:hypothetical protein